MVGWELPRKRRPRPWRVFITSLWALIPVATLGFGTLPLMVHAAVRMKSRLQTLAVLPYVVATTLVFAFDPDTSSTADTVFGTGLLINIIGGVSHAFAIRSRMWIEYDEGDGALVSALRDKQRAVLTAHRDEQAAREAARAIAASDPRQAVELRIGRADLPGREFPDGGLVDVNNVPGHVLAQALTLSDAVAAEVVRTRTAVGGFASVAELSVTTDLPPRHLDPVADRLVFLPPAAQR